MRHGGVDLEGADMAVRLSGIAAGVVFIFTACATPAPLTLNDDLIVRAERIGDVELGMSLANLLALKGTPRRTVPLQGTTATSYEFDGLAVAAKDEVYWISAQAPRFKTANGIATGVEQIAARAAAGPPICVITKDEETTYDYRDFYFVVENATAKVTEVGVRVDQGVCLT